MYLEKQSAVVSYEGLHSEAVLDALPDELRELLLCRGELVSLASPRILTRAREIPRYAHVLLSGAASLVTVLQDGRTIQADLVGPGSLVEVNQIVGAAQVFTEAVVTLEGTAFRLPFRDVLTAVAHSPCLHDYVLREIQHHALVASQLVACTYYHELEQRLASLLLALRAHARSSQFRLTQESLASMLGVRRTTLTVAAGKLQRRKLIQYNRGQIEICCPEQLAKTACECYGVINTINTYCHLM